MGIDLKRLFKKEKQEHRILRQMERSSEELQPEYHRATPVCPHPERWSMFDSMTAEVEVLEFLRTVVTTLKPELVAETGTFSGISTLWIAEGLKENGRGKVITCAFDPLVSADAQTREGGASSGSRPGPVRWSWHATVSAAGGPGRPRPSLLPVSTIRFARPAGCLALAVTHASQTCFRRPPPLFGCFLSACTARR